VRQVRAKKANVSEPLMTCRKRIDDIKTEESRYLGSGLGDTLLTAQVVSGIKVARSWLRLWCGTWEPVASKAAVASGSAPTDRSRETPKQLKL
jgi:hypothetical protein